MSRTLRSRGLHVCHSGRIWGRRIFLYTWLASPILSAQTRAAYQEVYREWQLGDPSLERDAASARDALMPRTEKAAADAGKYIAARRAFYDAQRAILEDSWKLLGPVQLPPEPEGAKAAEAYLSPQETSVANSVELFGGDADPGIQQLRLALEKERQTLIALKSTIRTRENAMDTLKEANDSVDHAIARATERVKAISASFEQSAQVSGQLGQAWPVYYRALSNGARGLKISEASPFDAAERAAAPAPESRFAGLWAFEFGVSTYKGPSPFTFDLFLREENGQILGSLSAHFLVTGKTDPNVRFDFSGPVQETGSVSIPVQGEGVKGVIELMPGTAPNLLEVNFKLEGGAPGKIHEAGVILVKR